MRLSGSRTGNRDLESDGGEQQQSSADISTGERQQDTRKSAASRTHRRQHKNVVGRRCACFRRTDVDR